jgi:hypothetical protein
MDSRLALIGALAGLGLAAGGCSSTSDLVDSVQSAVHDFNPFGAAKKPLPGQRQAVFPEGVPGVEQGIPPHLMQGQQQIPDPNAPAMVAAPAAEPAPAAQRPQKPKPRPVRTARPRPAESAARPARAAKPAQPGEAPWPAPAQQQPAQQQPAQTQWPAPAASQPPQTVWPDPPKAGTFTR